MSDKTQSHEDFSRHQEIKAGSERAFGLVFAAVFLIIGLWPLVKGADPRLWALPVAGLFALLALAAPRALRPLNLLWFRFGLLLHAIVNPVIMGLLFFTTVTPIALIMRILGKDPLRLKFDKVATTYWIERDPPGPAPDSMRHQF